MPVSGFRFAWGVRNPVTLLTKYASGGTNSGKFFQWSKVENGELPEDLRDVHTPFGGTFGNLLDSTPGTLTTKVIIEEKFYSTWYHGRTILLGDGMLLTTTWMRVF